MGTGPIPSSKKALELAGWSVKDVDLFEINEAFAAQRSSFKNTLYSRGKSKCKWRSYCIRSSLGIHEMIKRDVKKGLATLCIGGGMGIAMCIER